MKPAVVHFAGPYHRALCTPSFYSPHVTVSQDKAKVTCRLCWHRIVSRKAKKVKTKNGLRQSAPQTKPSPVSVIMRNGVPLMPKKLQKVLPIIQAANDHLERLKNLSPKRSKGSLVGSDLPLGSGSVPTSSPTPTARTSNPGERIGSAPA